MIGQHLSNGTQLLRVLGRGTHSVVYLAVTPRGQFGAVKVFPPENFAFAEREYEYGFGLSHPHLSAVLGRTLIGGQQALLVTYAPGATLFERYQQRPALRHEREAFVQTLLHLLDALAYLHGRGLVHRDVKPDNIMVEEDGSARLVDYDLTGPLHEKLSGAVKIGTPAFQSPEAQRGDPLGPESDLYSVGTLLHWGLYGELPDSDEPPTALQDPLVTLAAKLCETDSATRPQDAAQVYAQLTRLAALSF